MSWDLLIITSISRGGTFQYPFLDRADVLSHIQDLVV